MRRVIFLLIGIFSLLSGAAQVLYAAQQVTMPLPEAMSLHTLVDAMTPINSFFAGALWIKLAWMRDDIERLNKIVFNRLLERRGN